MMNDLLNIKFKILFILALSSGNFLKAATLKDSTDTFSKLNAETFSPIIQPNHHKAYSHYERANTGSRFLEFEDCDVCGCGSSGGSMGYGTIGNGNFVGLRYIYQRYKSKNGIYDNSPQIDENFNTIQAWARIPLTQKIKVNVIVPYHIHTREFVNGSFQSINGLGDVSILGFYQLISPRLTDYLQEEDFKFKHNLEVGMGLKLPTGEYDRTNNQGSVNPSFQVGTGSWDFLLASGYTVNYKDWGLDVLANYTIKTENSQEYQFGNQLNYGVNVYHSFNFMNNKTFTPFSFTPTLGIAGEVFEENESYGLRLPDTRGNILFSRLGVEAGYGRMAAGINVMLPVMQNLNAGNVESKMRLGIHLNFVL